MTQPWSQGTDSGGDGAPLPLSRDRFREHFWALNLVADWWHQLVALSATQGFSVPLSGGNWHLCDSQSYDWHGFLNRASQVRILPEPHQIRRGARSSCWIW